MSITYTDEPMDVGEAIPDFLPAAGELVPKEERLSELGFT
jgi:hypothetical protein